MGVDPIKQMAEKAKATGCSFYKRGYPGMAEDMRMARKYKRTFVVK